jgi:ADP-ribose pyrophosphatase YjhB (NUDIX family)
MDYILPLGQYIGNRPIRLVGAAVLVLDEQKRLLMLKRSDIGCWGIPGGRHACARGHRTTQRE